MNLFSKIALITVGTLSVGLGILGIFLPLLPATPFLLLAAACYSRSSDKFYNGLLGNRWFGEYIRNYREGRGMSVRIKVIAITFLVLTMGYSIISVVPNVIGKLSLLLIAIGVAMHILTLPTMKKSKEVHSYADQS